MAFPAGLRAAGFGLLMAAGLALGATGQAAAASLKSFSDADLAHGFFATVFGLEHGAAAGGRMVKKFHGPVRVAVEAADSRRAAEVAAFVRRLPGLVPGLDLRLAGAGESANFVVHVVDRAAYSRTVRQVAYGGAHGAAPGRCMVKVDFTAGGIARSDAFIVADEGEHLFRRCMVEEILQGLGPMNDDRSLHASVFNDSSRHTRLGAFDRAIVAMLYDRRVRHGMGRGEVEAIMPDLVARARRAVR